MMLTQGTWVECVDETTSIQVFEAVIVPDPPIAGAPMRQSPRDHRRGTRQLLAGRSVADGQVIEGAQAFCGLLTLCDDGAATGGDPLAGADGGADLG